MAKQKKDATKAAVVVAERLRKKIATDRRQIVQQTSEIATLDAIVVVEQSNIDLLIAVIRTRQFHVKDDLDTFRAEINRVHGAGLWPEMISMLDGLEAECDSILTTYPEGWPI